jgi:uncharacterized protein
MSAQPPFVVSRRTVLGGGLAGLAWLWAGRRAARADARGVLGFASLAATNADRVTLPPGYEHRVVFAWGDPVVAGAPPFDPTARQDARAQERQAGMHHDGMELFRVPVGPEGAASAAPRWLLAVNHEFADEGLLHPAYAPPDAARVARSQAAVGASVIEVRPRAGGGFEQVPDSPYGRRITARTPMTIVGPAAGHPLLVTGADPTGRHVRGTLANCAAGRTPWGTYLTCEENIQYFFVRSTGTLTGTEAAYGLTDLGLGYGWHAVDPRFDVAKEPHEVHRFGWVVEIDPADPAGVPRKLTALGRFAHENACVRAEPGRPLVVYLGDDAPFEFLYKFVSAERYDPSAGPAALRRLLEAGTLHVARLAADGRGEWLPLVQGRPGLSRADGFPDQAHVLTFARLAGRAVSATPLDRPEWVALHPTTKRVFVSLTNNTKRGGAGLPGADAGNPAAPNVFGHVLALDEDGDDGAAVAFRFTLFARGGEHGWIEGAATNDAHPAFGSPDGLVCDARGVLWIQTDVGARALALPAYAGFPNNQMLAVDPVTHEVRRFLVGPVGAEITGVVLTDDLTTMLVNVQHPGEPGLVGGEHTDPTKPWRSSWPANDGTSRPRSATVAIWRTDGRPVGA